LRQTQTWLCLCTQGMQQGMHAQESFRTPQSALDGFATDVDARKS